MVTKYEVIVFDLGETLVKDKNWLPGAQKLLRLLFEDKIRLGIISNTGDFSRAALLAALPTDFPWGFFESDLIILSSEVNVKKPSPEIFRIALKKTSCDPARCLFCTENVVDGLVAQQLGMHVYRVQSPPASDIDQVYTNLSNI
ncbi:HAD family hydrolase [Dyadobacter endophyticus]|uniref:HAD family hydrolase n=1 Tax=Dyadobacter endophyticus TaxID=1749036 RepID=UPI001666F561|nr:HAD family hydrolase [Dyadobacter endophyticus]